MEHNQACGRTKHLKEAFNNRLHLFVHQNERKEAHMHNIEYPYKIFRQILVHVPVSE